MPGVMWLPVSMSDVDNDYKEVGPASLTVRPTVYFVQGPQRLWALESQSSAWQPHWASRPGTASTGVRVSLGNSPSPRLEDTPSTVHHDVLHTKRCTPWSCGCHMILGCIEVGLPNGTCRFPSSNFKMTLFHVPNFIFFLFPLFQNWVIFLVPYSQCHIRTVSVFPFSFSYSIFQISFEAHSTFPNYPLGSP